MAKFKWDPPEKTIAKLAKLGKKYDEIVGNMLEEGIKPLEHEAKKNLKNVIGQNTKHPSKSTGDLLRSLKVTKTYQVASGDWHIKLASYGYDRNKNPNPLKAIVLEKGRSDRPAKPWLKPALKATREKCYKKMEEILDKELDKL